MNKGKISVEYIKKQRDLYDKVAETYDEGDFFWHYARKRKLAFLMTGLKREFSDLKGKLIIDIGCGTGEYMVPFVRDNTTVCGIDFSINMLRTVRRNARVCTSSQ